MSFSGEIDQLPLIQEQREELTLLERAFSSPEAMMDVIRAEIAGSYEGILKEYPYLVDREYVSPPIQRDWAAAARIYNSIMRDEVGTAPISENDIEPHIVEEPAEVPTIQDYVSMLQRYWNSDGCSTCGMCEEARFGGRTSRLIKHQSKVMYATQVLARIGADDALVEIADMSIQDGLEAYVLTRAIEANHFLPRTLARLEKLISDDQYMPFNAPAEYVRLAGPELAGVSIIDKGPLRQQTYDIFARSALQTQEIDRAIKERLAKFAPQVPVMAAKLAYKLYSGENPIPYAQDLQDTKVDIGYAVVWLDGYGEAFEDLNGYNLTPRLHPDLYNDDTHGDANHSERNAAYSLAFAELHMQEEAWLHAIDISDEDMRMNTMFALAEAGNDYAYAYLDEHTR